MCKSCRIKNYVRQYSKDAVTVRKYSVDTVRTLIGALYSNSRSFTPTYT